MAVPKRKSSPSRSGMRRSHSATVKPQQISIDKTTGEAKLPHRMSLKDGFYNGKQVLVVAKKSTEEAVDEV